MYEYVELEQRLGWPIAWSGGGGGNYYWGIVDAIYGRPSSMASGDVGGDNGRGVFGVFTVEFLAAENDAGIRGGIVGGVSVGSVIDIVGGKVGNVDIGAGDTDGGCFVGDDSEDSTWAFAGMGRPAPFASSLVGFRME